MNGQFLERHLHVGLRERQILTVFWAGFVMYSLSYVLLIPGNVNAVILNAFQILGLALFFTAGSSLAKNTIRSSYLNILFFCYMLWSLFIIARGYMLNYEYIKLSLIDAWFGVLIYITPLFLLMPRKLYYLKRLFQVAVVLGVCYILYDLVYIKDLIRQGNDIQSQNIIEYLSKTLGVPVLFLVLTFRYHPVKTRLLTIIVVAVTALFALIRARRGLLIMTALPVFFGYLLFLSQQRKKAGILLLSLIVGGIFLFFGAIIYRSSQDSLFGYISERGLEDTRSKVELCYLNDMTMTDWLIGKGIEGDYFCPGIDPDDTTGYRSVIETDYLQMILKGGLVSLLLFLAMAVPALFKGLFYSQNLLSKAAGAWILWFLLNMYPSSMHTFTLQCILMWVAVGICYSKTIRTIPDQVLVDYFGNRKNAEEIAEGVQNETINLK